jgi:glycosyltransferase 2 family protein
MKFWKPLLLALVTLLLLFLFFRNVNLQATLAAMRSVPLWFPLLYGLSLVPQHALRAWRWGFLLRPHKEGIRFRSLFSATVIGFMISYLLPGRLGEVVRPVLLAEREGLSKGTTMGTVVVERLFDVLAVFLLFLAALTVFPLPPTAPLRTMRRLVLIALPLILAFFAMLAALNGKRGLVLVERFSTGAGRLLPARWRERGTELLHRFIGGMHLGLGWRRLSWVLCLSLAMWLYAVPFFWILMKGFPDPALQAVSLPGTFAYFGILFVSAAVPTPGMAGSFDVASRYGLTVLFGVGEGPAVAYTLLVHFLIVLVPVMLGLWALAREGLTLAGLRRMGRKS